MDRCTCNKFIRIKCTEKVGKRIEFRSNSSDRQLAIFIFEFRHSIQEFFIKYYVSPRSPVNYCCSSTYELAQLKANISSALHTNSFRLNTLCDIDGCNKLIFTHEELVQITILYLYSNDFETDFIHYVEQFFSFRIERS